MMTEVVYLPLKSAGGAVLGHARIAGGVCRFRLRRPVSGQAVVLSEDGMWSGAVEEAIPARGKLYAVAVLEDGQLLCCGALQGQQVSFQQLQRRLVHSPKSAASKASLTVQAEPVQEKVPEPQKTVVRREPETQQAEPVKPPMHEESVAVQAEPPAPVPPAAVQEVVKKPVMAAFEQAQAAQTVTDGEPPIAARSFAPAEPQERETELFVQAADSPMQVQPFEMMAESWAEPAAAPMWEDEGAREAFAGEPEAEADADDAGGIVLFGQGARGNAAQSITDSAADSAAFAALLRRAELVFESIESPQPPIIGGRRTAARQAGEALSGRSVREAAAEPYRPQQAYAASAPAAGTAAQRSWGQEVERLLGERPAQTRTQVENPFPHIFPGAVFYSVSGSGVQAHLEGDWVSGGEKLRIYAVQGSYSPQPPAHLAGYTRFIRTQQASYWVRVTGV